MNRRGKLLLIAVLLAGASAVALRPSAPGLPDRIASVLRDSPDTAGYPRVLAPRRFEFPRDHAAHPEYRHEWWYVTGHLQTDDGQSHGFQLTFFRYALAPQDTPSSSAWRARQVMLGHFALTDKSRKSFESHDRRARAALGIAGASTAAPRVWIKDWSLQSDGAGERWDLEAAVESAGLKLRLVPIHPLVLQGDAGLSRKSAVPGNASYYYSLPRLALSGRLRTAAGSRPVTGTGWLDHEWGSSALGPDQVGWDWFSLQLEDGRDLSFYRLRRTDTTVDPSSHGLLLPVVGEPRPLAAEGVRMSVLRRWQSPQTGIAYPVAWRVEIPAEGLDLQLEASVDGQEWTGDLRYWEGAINVRETQSPRRTLGQGYLELTGYGK